MSLPILAPRLLARKVATFAMLFFAMTSFMNMYAHACAIGIVAFGHWRQGLFVYDYQFYPLMLMVFILLGCYRLHQIKQIGQDSRSVRLLVAGTIQIFFSLPLFPLNPMA